MELMRNPIRPYAWGSRTAIAELLGEESPARHPQAEMWMGAHPGDPSTLLIEADGSEQSLARRIEADAVAALGDRVTAAFGARLPFLMKVLAAGEPLSLQAHPSMAQAEQGYDAEQAAGIPLNSPDRNYKDRSHKPEIICALTQFHALCGFRAPEQTTKMLAELGIEQLDHYASLLSTEPEADGVRALFSSLITIPSSHLGPLLSDVMDGAVAGIRSGSAFSDVFRTALELGERYPGDAGVLAALMMNRVTLQPGESLYMPAGHLHAYLFGTGIELMANSDNVLRGGLTPKHVDVPELMRVLEFEPGEPAISAGEPAADRDPDSPSVNSVETVYPVPVREFRLSRINLADGSLEVDVPGPQILLTVEGELTLTAADGRVLALRRGRSAWISADERGVRLSGTGVAFRATDGLPM